MKYEENLSAFQKLLLLRCFRVDRIYRAVTDYITVIMGEKWDRFYCDIAVEYMYRIFVDAVHHRGAV